MHEAWLLLFDREVPRLTEGADVQLLWASGYYDGPASGCCAWKGRSYHFDRISGGAGYVEYRGLEIASYIYTVVEISEAEFAAEKFSHDRFRELVGKHCDYTYKVTEGEDGREYKRVRGPYADIDKDRMKAFYDERPPFDPFRFYSNPVVGWWST